MDVDVPEIPAEFDEYRAQLRAFIAVHRPQLRWKPGVGLRVPEDPDDVAKLRTWVRALYDAGYVVDQYGTGVGVTDRFARRVLAEELGRSGIPFVLGNPLAGGAIAQYGTDEQKQTYLPRLANGEHIWTQLFSEPDAGSDLTSLTTRAELAGDHYIVNGQKVWSTWAQHADYGYLLARTEPIEGSAGLSAFILDMRSPGTTTRPLREITGTTDFNEVFLDNVAVPVANMIGAPGAGWRVAGASLAQERGGVGAGGSGGAIARLVRVARECARNGRPALDDSSVRQDIGAFVARSRIQRYLGYAVSTRAARGTLEPWDAPTTKIWFSELNLEMSDYAMMLQGPRGALVEGDVLAYDDGYWQDSFLYARAWTIAGGSNEIMRNLIAERGLGLPREPRP
jgi:alkylation response protein AidB-like acyl-CoA dehydrogenase